MNRKDRRLAQSQEKVKRTIRMGEALYSADEAHHWAVQAYLTGQFQLSVDWFRAIIAKHPADVQALCNLANGLQQLERYGEALAHYERAIALKADHAEAYNNRGVTLQKMKRYDEALSSYDQAIALKPDYAAAYSNRGITVQEMKQTESSLADYDKAIALRPDYPEAYCNRGNALKANKQHDRALADYDKAIALRSDCTEAHYNKGIALHEMKRFDEAAKHYSIAITLQPDYSEAYCNLGNAFKAQRRYREALADYDKAMVLKPAYTEAHYNKGIVLQETRRLGEAVQSYRAALACNPSYGEAHYRLGLTFELMKRPDEAMAQFEQAAALNRDLPDLLGMLFHARMQLCQWREYEAMLQEIAAKLEEGKQASTPFAMLSTPLPPMLQRRCAEIVVDKKFPDASARWELPIEKHERIRIGYFSSDFRNHALSYLLADFFARHDRARFEVFAFSFAPEHDEVTEQVRGIFEHFFDVREQSDEEIIALAREQKLDIAVNLNGFTSHNRTAIFAPRLAPVQVSYMGYPGTMGAKFIDYVVADAVVIPPEHNAYYTEKVVRLPYTYWATDSTRVKPVSAPSRSEAGLPEEGFVFCCFNNTYKITPDVFEIWMRLLRQVEGSVLWLLEGSPAASANLRREAEARGIAGDRLVFAKRMPLDDHLARHKLADLFVDTFYYNAHTTASDALWMGVPMVTCLGPTFAGRVAASILQAVGLPELITESHAAYEALALALARDGGKLGALRQKLAESGNSPLFDTARFTRDMEQAYVHMWERSQAGQAVEDIAIHLSLCGREARGEGVS